jgi:hypothetical protein
MQDRRFVGECVIWRKEKMADIKKSQEREELFRTIYNYIIKL